MNTASWGPDGWKLLHSIAYCYTFNDDNDNQYHSIPPSIYKRFFAAIQHLLPCVYCRRSYAQYMKDLPIKEYLEPKRLFYHIYLIHNKVNAKLRDQGYNDKPDPSYEEVKQFYKGYVKKLKCLVGWHFLYCMVFTYPEDGDKCSQRRKKAYLDFFGCLTVLLPCQRIREKYCKYFDKKPMEDWMSSRELFKRWLHGLERAIRGERCKPFKVRCDIVEESRVEKCDGGTCRK